MPPRTLDECAFRPQLWDVDVWTGMLDDGITELENRCERRREENLRDDTNFSDTARGPILDPLEVAIGKVTNIKRLLKLMPTNFDDTNVPRFSSQLIIQEKFLVSMIPAFVGNKWSTISDKMRDYYVVDFNVPIQAGVLSRRSGKTTSVAQLIVLLLYLCPNFSVILLSKTIPQAHIILDMAKRIIKSSFSQERFVITKDSITCLHGNLPPAYIQIRAAAPAVSAAPTHPSPAFFTRSLQPQRPSPPPPPPPPGAAAAVHG